MYEVEKYRSIVLPWIRGNVLDLGSGGCPVVNRAIQVELPEAQYSYYNSGAIPKVEPQWRGDAFDLPFKDGTVDTVFSSHLLEDVKDWNPVLTEWVRVLKTGGRLVILIPDKERWLSAVAAGQPPNCAHKHEGHVGELTKHCVPLGMTTIIDSLTNQSATDYSLLYVGEKL
jgi:SAM-dependent methyltransferase